MKKIKNLLIFKKINNIIYFCKNKQKKNLKKFLFNLEKNDKIINIITRSSK